MSAEDIRDALHRTGRPKIDEVTAVLTDGIEFIQVIGNEALEWQLGGIAPKWSGTYTTG